VRKKEAGSDISRLVQAVYLFTKDSTVKQKSMPPRLTQASKPLHYSSPTSRLQRLVSKGGVNFFSSVARDRVWHRHDKTSISPSTCCLPTLHVCRCKQLTLYREWNSHIEFSRPIYSILSPYPSRASFTSPSSSITKCPRRTS
jgi:hypothetical protein